MRLRHLVGAALGLLLVACGGKSSAAGTWVVDKDALRAVIDASMPAEQKKAMAEHPEMKQMVDKMMEGWTRTEFELKSDGSVGASGDSPMAAKARESHWKQDGNVVTFTDKDGTTTTSELRDGKLYLKIDTVGPMSGKEVVFVRK